jgi:hypothetical protein
VIAATRFALNLADERDRVIRITGKAIKREGHILVDKDLPRLVR